MIFFTRIKLATLDKKIIKELRKSSWFTEHKEMDGADIALSSINQSEKWVELVHNFIEIVWNKDSYKKIFDKYNVSKNDLIDYFFLMTIATLPDPLFRTANSKLSNTMTATAMYQEIEKQLIPFLSSLGSNYSETDKLKYGHKYASDAKIFGYHLKSAHDRKYGKLSIEEIL